MTNRKKLVTAAALLLAAAGAGCGDVSQGRAPVQVVIAALEGASGAEPDEFGGTLASDVVTLVEQTIDGEEVRVPTIFADNGRVTMRLVLRDPGVPGITAAPSSLNQVTFTRYRVRYRRTDGRNTEGVDVPYAFDSAATFTVPNDGSVEAAFLLVRVTAKEEAPLRGLVNSPDFIATIAEVTFFGEDLAGNAVTVSGSIGITFGNWGDPQ